MGQRSGGPHREWWACPVCWVGMAWDAVAGIAGSVAGLCGAARGQIAGLSRYLLGRARERVELCAVLAMGALAFGAGAACFAGCQVSPPARTHAAEVWEERARWAEAGLADCKDEVRAYREEQVRRRLPTLGGEVLDP